MNKLSLLGIGVSFPIKGNQMIQLFFKSFWYFSQIYKFIILLFIYLFSCEIHAQIQLGWPMKLWQISITISAKIPNSIFATWSQKASDTVFVFGIILINCEFFC